ncbi:MAG: hypothetical protein IPG92_05685 [Flavobacteriales bacterium]|nr:hypothetical protein [Flavobacteriales bacterium]
MNYELDWLISTGVLEKRSEDHSPDLFSRNFRASAFAQPYARLSTDGDGYGLRECAFRFKDSILHRKKWYALSFFSIYGSHDGMDFPNVFSTELKIQGFTRFVSAFVQHKAPGRVPYHAWNHALNFRFLVTMSKIALVISTFALILLVYQLWELLWAGNINSVALRWNIFGMLASIALFWVTGGRISWVGNTRKLRTHHVFSQA